jgi:NodT family efflux transporter outer membrane factor (OMF) lipoprotein
MVRITRRAATILIIGVSVVIVSCATPEMPPPARQQTNLPIEKTWQTGQETEPRLVDDGWLSNFQDKRLSQLVEEALRNNRDLQGSAAVVAEAEARARQAGANLRPTVDLAADAAVSGTGNSSSTRSQYNLGLQVSWEVDLWDRLGSESRAQALDAIAAAADYEFARQSLAARVAVSWFVTIGNKLQLALDEDVLLIERDTLRVVQLRVNAGAVSRVDLNVARADVARAKENVARSQGNLDEAVRSLEVLLGRYPAAELNVTDQLTSHSEPVPAGLPSELLERRPDLIARDRQVAAAFNRTQAAQAARLPRLALTGSVGGASGSLRDILNSSNVAWSLGTNLLAPIYDGGRLQADVEIRTAQQEQALAAYAGTALQAFEEVETALSNERVLLVREKRLTIVVEELAEAVRILELRYNAGEIDLLSLNQVKKSYFTARNDLLRVQVERLKQRVNLHLALGGSFEARPQS